MYFLVILICLTINYLWLKDLDRFSDAWFFQFHGQVEKLTAETAAKISNGWILTLMFVYGVPLLVVGILLIWLDDVFFDILIMLVHILVLLIAFDRTQPGKLARDFIALWKQGDHAACKLFLQRELATDADAVEMAEDNEGLAAYFSKQLTYRCFEKMFVVFFWYMVTGPLGVVFCYVTYQLRDSQSGSATELALHTNRVLIRILEWIPMRLLVLSFSLAGNFVKCFTRLQHILWDFSLDANYAELLYEFAGAALLGTEYSDAAAEDESAKPLRHVEEIEELQALLERSQLIWLSVLALITVFGTNA